MEDDSASTPPWPVTVLRCPACGALAAVPFLLGLPGLEHMEAADRGEVVLGGCIFHEDAPRWECLACATGFGRRPEPDALPNATFARVFAEYFANWQIELPESANALRIAGAIDDQGWDIRWVFGRSDDGREHLDVYASHRMTNDRHFRIHPDGSTEDLPALEEFLTHRPGEDERDARERYVARNREIEQMLRAKGLYPEGSLRAHIATHVFGGFTPPIEEG